MHFKAIYFRGDPNTFKQVKLGVDSENPAFAPTHFFTLFHMATQ
jgi:hypothetical protein